MKKFFLLLMLALVFMLGGCGQDNLAILQKNSVESRDAYFVSQDKDNLFTLVSGKREDPYQTDGVVEKLVDFALFSFEPAKVPTYTTLHYFVVIDNIEYEGDLEKSDYSSGYVVDLEIYVPQTATVSARVFKDDFEAQANLVCVSKDFATSQTDAIKIAYNALKGQIDDHISKDTLCGEVYVKIWKDFSSEQSEYYWYVGFACKEQTYGVLINASTGKVVSIKK